MAEKKLALVTGAARGIGRAITERLATAGYSVVAIDALSETLHATATELKGSGLDVRPIVFDLADSEDIARIPSLIGDDFNRVAVLVNNAGISPKHNGASARVCDVALAEWDRVLRVNLTAPFRMTQLCLPPMRARGWGRIVNVSSKGGRIPSGVAGAHYVSSKSGVFGLTKITAMEVAGEGITVNKHRAGAHRNADGAGSRCRNAGEEHPPHSGRAARQGRGNRRRRRLSGERRGRLHHRRNLRHQWRNADDVRQPVAATEPLSPRSSE